MGRVLSGDPCKVTFADQISGSTLGIYYRLPTNAERVRYMADMSPKPGSEEEKGFNPADIRARYGLLIITGFDDGAFEAPDETGEKQAISSSPQAANFDSAWKDRLMMYAPDVLGLLGLFVFENALIRLGGSAIDPFGLISKN